MTKVAIIGASGMAGSAIYQQAAGNEGLAVTGIIRDEAKARQVLGSSANLLVGDVLTLSTATLGEFDIIVDAFNPGPAHADQQLDLAKKLVRVAHQHPARLIFILGAGSLRTGSDRHHFVEDIAKTPGADKWINTPRQQLKEYQYLMTVNDVDWLGISPSAMFVPGPASKYVIGGDDLLVNGDGQSQVTAGTMAKLVINEVCAPHYHQQRITVIDA